MRALQVAINKRRRARRLGTILVDGEYGHETHKAAFETAWLLGIGSRRTPTGAFPVSSQKLVRNPAAGAAPRSPARSSAGGLPASTPP